VDVETQQPASVTAAGQTVDSSAAHGVPAHQRRHPDSTSPMTLVALLDLHAALDNDARAS
jgi:hypothetical protein